MTNKGGEVRITGGECRGRKIKTPGGGTHPMGERERIALFNMLGTELEDARVLDAYCGGGTLGIEALSRGARGVVFIEKNHQAMRTTQENCQILQIPEEKAGFYHGSVGSLCEESTASVGKVDIILADPPYDASDGDEIERLANMYLMSGGLLVLSHPGDVLEFSGMELVKSRKYAGATISIYRKA